MRKVREVICFVLLATLFAVFVFHTGTSIANAQRRELGVQRDTPITKPKVAKPVKISPIVFRFGTAAGIEAGTQNMLLLGGAQGKSWATIPATAKSLKGGENYRFYGLTNTVGTAVSSRTVKSVASGAIMVPFRKGPDALAHIIGISGAKKPLPSKPTVLSNAHADYLKIVASVLKSHGIVKSKPNIRRIIRIRLDRNTYGVLIEAATPNLDLSDGTLKNGQYSMVLLRTFVNGAPKTYELMSAFGTVGKAGTNGDIICNLVGAYDLNGDGKLEIAVAWHYYEGYGASIFEFDKGTPKRVLESADGV